MKKYTSYSYPCIDYEKLEYILTHECPNQRLSIYGFGHFGKMLFDTCLWNSNYTVECFLDVNSEKYKEEQCLGIPIITPIDYVRDHFDSKIIVSVFGLFDEVYKYLTELGIKSKNVIALPFKTVSGRILKADKNFDTMSAQIGYAIEMSDEPIVTVCSIIYNTPVRLLRRAIESVLNQTYHNYVYTIVDNGSLGETKHIINEYADKDKRITVIQYDENISPADINRIGKLVYRLFHTFKTKYMCLLDSDDYYADDFLEKAVLLAEKNKADAVKVQTLQISEEQFEMINKPRGVNKTIIADSTEAIAAVVLEGFGYMGNWGALWKTSTFLSRSVETSVFGFDYWWVLNTIRNGKCIVMLDEVLHFQTSRQDSISRKIISSIDVWSPMAEVVRHCMMIKIILSSKLTNDCCNYNFLHYCSRYLKLTRKLSGIASKEINSFVDNLLIDFCEKRCSKNNYRTLEKNI